MSDGILWYGSTHKGRRSVNQDGVLALAIDEKKPILVFAVADGMGGAAAGDVASAVSLAAFAAEIEQYFSESAEPHDLGGILDSAMDAADSAVKQAVQEHSEYSGMGSTLVAILMIGEETAVAHIGDSRAYLVRDGRLRQITRDHTALQETLERNPNVDLREAAGLRNVLTRVLNGNGYEPDIIEGRQFSDWVASGCGLLLCSDGLLVKSRTLGRCPIDEFRPTRERLPEDVAQLVEAAYEAGTTDNISVLCVMFAELSEHDPSVAPEAPWYARLAGVVRRLARGCEAFVRSTRLSRPGRREVPRLTLLQGLLVGALILFLALLWWLWSLI